MDGNRHDERRLKLELRLAQLEKNEACKNNFLSSSSKPYGRLSYKGVIMKSSQRS